MTLVTAVRFSVKGLVESDLVALVTAVCFSLQIAAISMAATSKTCITCARQFIDTHALKSHQPKCKGRANVHAHGLHRTEPKKKLGRKLAHHMNATEEEVALERQELREHDEPEPARKQKDQFNVSVILQIHSDSDN